MNIGIRLEDYKQPLEKLSYDDGNEKISLIEASGEAYNFDGITQYVCKKLRGGEKLTSCDALVVKDGLYYLVEFKNQAQTKIDKRGIWKKAYDSVSTVRMVLDQNIGLDDFARKATLLIVFQDEEISGFPHLKEKLFRLTKPERTEPLLFDLSAAEGTLYREIHTICKQRFMEQWYPIIWGEEKTASSGT